MNNMKLELTKKERIIIEYLKYLVSYLFSILLFVFLLFFLFKQFYPRIITENINLNYLMIIVIAFGTISIIFPVKKTIEFYNDSSISKSNLIFIITFGLIGGIIIYFKLKNNKIISVIISFLSFLIITLISYLLIQEKDESLNL
jgi:uncharacterized membrane protein